MLFNVARDGFVRREEPEPGAVLLIATARDPLLRGHFGCADELEESTCSRSVLVVVRMEEFAVRSSSSRSVLRQNPTFFLDTMASFGQAFRAQSCP